MKKLIAVAGLGAAITLGSLVGAGTASADTSSFLYAADNAGFYNSGGYDAELAVARGICSMLYSGYSEYQVQSYTYHHTAATIGWSDAGQLVALAQDHLC
jgi:hypothetical protein